MDISKLRDLAADLLSSAASRVSSGTSPEALHDASAGAQARSNNGNEPMQSPNPKLGIIAPISLEERTIWLRRLAGLAVRDGRSLEEWRAEVVAMLGSHPPLVLLQQKAAQLPAPGASILSSKSVIEKDTENNKSISEEEPKQTEAEFADHIRRIIDSAISV